MADEESTSFVCWATAVRCAQAGARAQSGRDKPQAETGLDGLCSLVEPFDLTEGRVWHGVEIEAASARAQDLAGLARAGGVRQVGIESDLRNEPSDWIHARRRV